MHHTDFSVLIRMLGTRCPTDFGAAEGFTVGPDGGQYKTASAPLPHQLPVICVLVTGSHKCSVEKHASIAWHFSLD